MWAVVVGVLFSLPGLTCGVELAEVVPAPYFPIHFPAPAEADPASTKQLKPLIASLGAAELEAREAGVAALRLLGAGVLPRLREFRQREEDPELRARLDDVLTGPRLNGLRALEWTRRLPDAGYDERLRIVDLLASRDEQVFPQAHAMLQDTHPLRRWAGLWLCARLGPKARSAYPEARAWLEEALARAERERCTRAAQAEQAACAGESPVTPWPVFLKPRDPELGDPPVVDFLLGTREGDGYSYPYDIRTTIQRALYDESRTGTVRAFSEPIPLGERPGLLWGTLLAFVHGMPDRDTRLTADPGLELTVVAYALERLGDGESDRGLLRRAQIEAVAWISGKSE